MIPVGAVIKPADNSGAKTLKVIGIPGSSRIRFAKLGDIVTVGVYGASSVGNVKDHTIYKAVIVRTKKEQRRSDGSYIRFDDNAAVLLEKVKDKTMLGSRVFGPIAREIRDLGFLKIASLAKEVW
jgi:large subunit ribosomal protein L14